MLLDIVRILFMVPIYSVVSFASYLFWVRSSLLLALMVLTPAGFRITRHLCSCFVIATNPQCSRHSFICYSRICLPIQRSRKPFFARYALGMHPHGMSFLRHIHLQYGLSREYDREARRKGGKPSKWMFPLSFIKSKPRVCTSSLSIWIY